MHIYVYIYILPPLARWREAPDFYRWSDFIYIRIYLYIYILTYTSQE